MPAAMDDYLFDLRGYLILRSAIAADHVVSLNAVLDSIPSLEYGQWWGNVQRKDDNGAAGCELQNIVEGGEPFERLIDHPSWIQSVIYRYGVSWGTTAHGYVYSPALLNRLTAERRKILQPVTPRLPEA